MIPQASAANHNVNIMLLHAGRNVALDYCPYSGLRLRKSQFSKPLWIRFLRSPTRRRKKSPLPAMITASFR